jgi:ribosomal protein S27E
MANHEIPCRGCGEDTRLLGINHEANCLAGKLDAALETIRVLRAGCDNCKNIRFVGGHDGQAYPCPVCNKPEVRHG